MGRRRKRRSRDSTKPPDSLTAEYRLAGILAGVGLLGLLLLGERNLQVLQVPVGLFEALIAFAYAFCAFLIGLAIFVITDFRPDPPRSFLGVRRHRRLMSAGRVLGYAIWFVAITVGMAALFEVLPRRRWWARDWDRSDWLVSWRLGLVFGAAIAGGVVVDASCLAKRKWLRFFSLARTSDWCDAWSPFWWRVRTVVLVAAVVLLLCLWIGSLFDPSIDQIIRQLWR